MPLDSRQMTFDISSDSVSSESSGPREILGLREALENSYQYYWNKGQSHFFYRLGIGSVHCRSFVEERNKSLLIISPGRAESSLKYAELCLELKGSGFDILVLDHRGQGFSERYFGLDNLGHVESFRDYADDFVDIVSHFQERKKYQKTIVLAHSMGAAIGLTGLLRAPGLCQGMILSSPMLKVLTRKVPEPLARMALKTMTKSWLKTNPVNRREGKDQREAFKINFNTGCEERFTFFREMEKRHPQIMIGSPTYGWLSEALVMGRHIWKEKKQLDCALLLIQAERDELVCNKAQDQFAHAVNNCRLIRLKESKHEVLQERNAIRNRALVQIHKFLKEHS
ncbi:MAG: alpha/beta hydrolase [Bacteriovoracaceae bacterium]|nr:alpha/beta hydrolase [Bacteriovoracaceae bacterium]